MIAVVGEALVDLVGAPDGRTYAAHPGGSPANVAVGLARLGTPAALWTHVGDDAFGRLLRGHLDAAGVAVHPVGPAGTPTSLAVATLDAAGGATYDFRIDWAVRLPDALPDPVRAVHTGSLALLLAPGRTEVEALLRRERARCTVSFDPNLRPALAPDPAAERARVDALVPLCDVVKVSAEDLAFCRPGEDPAGVAAEWLARGAALVVVTRGADGAYAAARSGAVLDVPAPTVQVVDTVGAGDAFTAGLLDGLARADLLGAARRAALAAAGGDVLAPILAEAVAVAALTCGRPGADPPTRAELAGGPAGGAAAVGAGAGSPHGSS